MTTTTHDEATEAVAKAQNENGRLTIAIHMEDGRPIVAKVFADHVASVVKCLRAIDKRMQGRITTEWYLVGFDIAAEGVAYQLQGWPRGVQIRVKGVNPNGPPLIDKRPDPVT